MVAKLKNELLEIEVGLQSLSAATREAEELKADLKTMMDDVKEHIRQNVGRTEMRFGQCCNPSIPERKLLMGYPSRIRRWTTTS